MTFFQSRILLFPFLLAFIFVLILPSLFPGLRLSYFAPFLVIASYRRSLLSCLWLSIICGLIIDILSSQKQFGFHAVIFTSCTFFLYTCKQHFFEEQISSIPLITVFFSILSSLLQIILIYVLGQAFCLSWNWFFYDLILQSLFDGIYALLCFIIPLFFLQGRRVQTQSFRIKRPR